MKVRDYLHKAPATVPPECTCQEAAALMRRFGVGALLVVEAGSLVGIVTDRDIVVRGVAAGRTPDLRVSDVMTADPVTVQGSADIEYAVVLFANGGFRRLPVLEDEELAGMLTVDDAVVGTVRHLEALLEPVTREISAAPGPR